MSRITLYFGALLIGIGIYFFVSTGSAHPTALIPVWFGLALGVLGVLASSKDASKRKLYMHIAVTIGLLGFLFPAFRSASELIKAHSDNLPLAHPAAVDEQLLMAILCFIFVLLCVRSFITARRSGIV
ncbi:MAG TPA: hypothetical protein VK814_09805 [Acidobacteriaceae bacterium]|jgi:hypothetical protein|nr:hypothetical protein [Acidobacteriaceae bacterium]